MKSGNLNFLEPSGPLQACNGTSLPLHHLDKFVTCPLCICYHVTTIICAFYTKHHKMTDCNSRLHRRYNTEDPQVNTNMFITQIYWNPGYTVVFRERLDCNEKQRYAPHKQKKKWVLIILLMFIKEKLPCPCHEGIKGNHRFTSTHS